MICHPVPKEGRWPSSRTLGRGAVDAAAPARRRDRRAGFIDPWATRRRADERHWSVRRNRVVL